MNVPLSLPSEERAGPSSETARLSSAYSDLVSYYQDFRRDRLRNQVLAPVQTGNFQLWLFF